MTEEILKDAIHLRKHLHEYPELSSEETETSSYLYKKLKTDCSPDQIVVFDHYGIAVLFKGLKEGRMVMIRGDFDALPIQEVNDFAHRSKTDGVSHKCGHDGHAAILYALARQLSFQRPETGNALLIFQPAEENGEGAKGVLHDPAFDQFKPDYVVALHNLPGYQTHKIVVRTGSFTAAANSIILKLKGKTSHAAEPELGHNPALAMAAVIQAFEGLNEPDLRAKNFRIATPIYTTMGERSYGVSAGYGELHYTLRAWETSVLRNFEEQCEAVAKKIAEEHGLEIEIGWKESFFANQNDERVIDGVRHIAEKQGYLLEERETPFKWGEDFGIFTEKFPGAMFGIGSGEQWPALHNPDYDFPDEIIPTGVRLFKELIDNLQE